MTSHLLKLPQDWTSVVGEQLTMPYYQQLITFLQTERHNYTVCPEPDKVFRALELVSYRDTKVLLLGQDPYHGPGQADGLCFSVNRNQKIPPSLRCLFKELHSDLAITPPEHGDLSSWCRQGVLMLNAVLTVRQGSAGSHAKKGWETFTDAIINALSERNKPLVFCLLGNYARNKAKLIDRKKHFIFEAPHPSPLSRKSFLGCKMFSIINQQLRATDIGEIDWKIE